MAKRTKYTSIITGDLIKSRNIGAKHWLPPLRKVLSTEGETPRSWEIFRGDSFQIEIKDPSQALLIAIRIKATLKCIKHLDVRMAIGIGEKDYAGAKITESNGNAFIFSGEKLEEITREKQNLGVRTPWPEFDREMNLYFRLALVIMDGWSTSSAELVRMLADQYGERKELKQTKLASKLKITQGSVSTRIKRAYYSEVHALLDYYHERIKSYIS
jgi:hypothetical protein